MPLIQRRQAHVKTFHLTLSQYLELFGNNTTSQSFNPNFNSNNNVFTWSIRADGPVLLPFHLFCPSGSETPDPVNPFLVWFFHICS